MKDYFSIEELININSFVQNLYDYSDLEEWFICSPEAEQRNLIKKILELVIQSHPKSCEIESAIDNAKLKKTYTPCVMLLNPKESLERFGYKLISLPKNELLKSFKLLLFTLKIADTRRKKEEQSETCNHWWHKDLSNKDYVEELKRRYSS
jgi:hypothetical protein